MLRRIKKDVENELTDKLEVLMYCPLTIRQKLLYMGLKRKIRIEELLQGKFIKKAFVDAAEEKQQVSNI